MAIYDRLKGIRVKNGLTQAEFGAAVGVSTNTQTRYEKGHRHPDTEYLRSVSNKFSVDFNWLIDGDTPINRMSKDELLDQADQIRSGFSSMFGMKPEQLDFLLQWLSIQGSLGRLDAKEQSILNSYRSTDSYGKTAIQAVSDAVRKGDRMQGGAVTSEAWGAMEFVTALQSALSEGQRNDNTTPTKSASHL